MGAHVVSCYYMGVHYSKEVTVPKNELLTYKELAAKLDRSEATIRRWVRKGMPSATVSEGLVTRRYFNLVLVEAWLKQQAGGDHE